jgi:hypothetical protein
VCEDELVCDLAETYHILNYKELSPLLVATLCFGLREDSRVKMKVSGTKLNLIHTLLAKISDEVAWQSWSKTKDGQKGRNRPESILKLLTEEKKDETESFVTGEDFEKVWAEICRKQ